MIFPVAHAQIVSPGVTEAANFVDKVNEIILFPLILLLTGVAMLYFMYGAFLYIARSDDPHAHEEGRSHMLWGVVGLFVMLMAFTILSVAAGTFGVQDELNCADDPLHPDCATSQFYDQGNLNECLTGGGC